MTVLLALKKWELALNQITISLNSSKIKMYVSFQQSLQIKEAYLHALLQMGKIDKESLDFEPRKFRLNKFLNNVPLYTADKRGSNISLLIVQLLFLLLQNKQDLMVDKTDALSQYCYRYLRNDETFRSNCFNKMLMFIPKIGFHPLRLERHANKLLKKLQCKPFKIDEQSIDIEIINFELLWEYILEQLDLNLSSKKRSRSGKLNT